MDYNLLVTAASLNNRSLPALPYVPLPPDQGHAARVVLRHLIKNAIILIEIRPGDCISHGCLSQTILNYLVNLFLIQILLK